MRRPDPEPGAPAEAPARLRRAERVLRDRTADLALLLEEPYDPGNLSATFRTAEALGVQDVHVVRREPWHVRRRVTQRADRWLSVRRWTRVSEALEGLHAEGYRVLVAALGRGAIPIDGVDPGARMVVAFGNESLGASEELLRGADGRFWIPTLGFTGSLNLSVSVAIALWELRRRQIESRGQAGDLSPARLEALREEWYGRLARGRPDRERLYASWRGRVAPDESEGPPPDRRDPAGADGLD